MPINLDTYPHPQLRYTVRLEYLHPVYDKVDFVYIYMTDEEFEKSYSDIIEKRKTEICEELGYNEGWEYEISEWGENYTENSFYGNEILSENVISLLKTGDITYPAHKDKDERELALAYLYSINDQYSKARVKKEIDNLPFTPLKDIVDRILSIWHTSTKAKKQKDGTIETKWSKRDQELSRLLNEKCKDAVETFRKDLHKLNERWGIRTEKDNYRRAVIIAKFLCDYPATKGLSVGFSEGMRVLSEYFDIQPTSYKRRVLIPTPEILKTLSKPQRAFQEQIVEPWIAFIGQF